MVPPVVRGSSQLFRDPVRLPATIQHGAHASHSILDAVVHGEREALGKQTVVAVAMAWIPPERLKE
jgi:hypothetical protein